MLRGARWFERTLGVRRTGAVGRLLPRTDFGRNRVANTAEGREHAQEGESATVDHFLPIHLNGQLAVVALDENGIDAQLLA